MEERKDSLKTKLYIEYKMLIFRVKVLYSHYTIQFMTFFILNLVVFSIGALFFELTFFKIIGFSVFNGIWMSISFLKINRYLLKRKKK